VLFRAATLAHRDRPEDRRQVVAKTIESIGGLEPLVSIDIAAAPWREKSLEYLAKRMLNIAPDESWRYGQSGPNTVLQRRLHTPLDKAVELDIAVAPDTHVHHVNLLIGRSNDHGSGQLVEYAGVETTTLWDGRRGVRLDLRDSLERRFPKEWSENAMRPGRHRFYLQEVVAFIPGEAGDVSRRKPVHALVLLGQAGGSQVTLPRRKLELNADQRRVIFDLRELSGLLNVEFTGAQLALLPPQDAASCAIRVDRMEAVSVFHGKVPAFVSELGKAGDGWGVASSATPLAPARWTISTSSATCRSPR
jgi:hypothetical protein